MGGRAGQALAAFTETARSANLRRAQLSFGAAWVAEWALTVAIGILAYRHGGAAETGIVAMARMLPAALIAPLAAFVVDRYRRERVLIAVCLVRGLALVAAAVAVSELSSPVAAYVLAAVATVAHTLYRPAHSALMPSLCTTPVQLTSTNVVRGLLDSSSALIGALAAGALVGPIGVSGVIALTGISSLWAGWLIARVRYEQPPRVAAAQAAHPLREAVEGFAVMRRDANIALMTMLISVQTFTRGCFSVFVVVIAIELLETGEAGVGVLTSAFGVGAVLGSFASSMLIGGSGFAKWFGAAVVLWSLPFALLSPVSNELLAFAMLALVGVANAVIDVTGFTLLQRLVPDEVIGRYFASFEGTLTFAAALGSIATAGLVSLFGPRGALLCVGLLGPLVVLLAWRRIRSIDVKLSVSDKIIAMLQRVAMLRPLPMATVARLAAAVSGTEVRAGSVVLAEGTTGDDFYVIAEGRAAAVQAGSVLRVMQEGDCFGEIAALGRGVRTSTVTAESDLRLLKLSGAHFVRAVSGYTPSQAAATELVQERLARSAAIG